MALPRPRINRLVAGAVMAGLMARPALACDWPQQPFIPDPAASATVFAGAHEAVILYVQQLDDFTKCVQAEIPTLKPLEAKAAHDEYLGALALMQKTVTAYNTALAKHDIHLDSGS